MPVPEPCIPLVDVGDITVSVGTEVEIKNDVGNPVPVSGSVDVPGVSTAANQATEIASLASIDAGIPIALGATTSANSMPVVIASDQAAIPVTGTFSLNVDTEVNSAFTHGQNTDIDSGAEEQIVVASNPSKHGVIVKAMPANTGIIYVGIVGVTTATGFPLLAGESLTIPVDDANKVYAIASIDNQGLAWMAT